MVMVDESQLDSTRTLDESELNHVRILLAIISGNRRAQYDDLEEVSSIAELETLARAHAKNFNQHYETIARNPSIALDQAMKDKISSLYARAEDPPNNIHTDEKRDDADLSLNNSDTSKFSIYNNGDNPFNYGQTLAFADPSSFHRPTPALVDNQAPPQQSPSDPAIIALITEAQKPISESDSESDQKRIEQLDLRSNMLEHFGTSHDAMHAAFRELALDPLNPFPMPKIDPERDSPELVNASVYLLQKLEEHQRRLAMAREQQILDAIAPSALTSADLKREIIRTLIAEPQNNLLLLAALAARLKQTLKEEGQKNNTQLVSLDSYLSESAVGTLIGTFSINNGDDKAPTLVRRPIDNPLDCIASNLEIVGAFSKEGLAAPAKILLKAIHRNDLLERELQKIPAPALKPKFTSLDFNPKGGGVITLYTARSYADLYAEKELGFSVEETDSKTYRDVYKELRIDNPRTLTILRDELAAARTANADPALLHRLVQTIQGVEAITAIKAGAAQRQADITHAADRNLEPLKTHRDELLADLGITIEEVANLDTIEAEMAKAHEDRLEEAIRNSKGVQAAMEEKEAIESRIEGLNIQLEGVGAQLDILEAPVKDLKLENNDKETRAAARAARVAARSEANALENRIAEQENHLQKAEEDIQAEIQDAKEAHAEQWLKGSKAKFDDLRSMLEKMANIAAATKDTVSSIRNEAAQEISGIINTIANDQPAAPEADATQKYLNEMLAVIDTQARDVIILEQPSLSEDGFVSARVLERDENLYGKGKAGISVHKYDDFPWPQILRDVRDGKIELADPSFIGLLEAEEARLEKKERVLAELFNASEALLESGSANNGKALDIRGSGGHAILIDEDNGKLSIKAEFTQRLESGSFEDALQAHGYGALHKASDGPSQFDENIFACYVWEPLSGEDFYDRLVEAADHHGLNLSEYSDLGVARDLLAAALGNIVSHGTSDFADSTVLFNAIRAELESARDAKIAAEVLAEAKATEKLEDSVATQIADIFNNQADLHTRESVVNVSVAVDENNFARIEKDAVNADNIYAFVTVNDKNITAKLPQAGNIATRRILTTKDALQKHFTAINNLNAKATQEQNAAVAKQASTLTAAMQAAMTRLSIPLTNAPVKNRTSFAEPTPNAPSARSGGLRMQFSGTPTSTGSGWTIGPNLAVSIKPVPQNGRSLT